MLRQLALRSDTYFCRENSRQAVPDGMKPFTLAAAWKLRRAVRAGEYDLVVSFSNPEPIWRQDTNWLSNSLKAAKKFLTRPGTLGFCFLPWILKGSTVALAVYEWEDNTVIARKNWALLRRATCYFKLQSPRNPYKAFFFQDKRNDCLFNIVRQPVYREWAQKLRPIGIGVTVPENLDELQAAEKKTDIFFAGATHYSWARLEGLRHLEELRQEGFKIDLHLTDAKVPALPPDEFLRRCSQAWLVWSPEGAGWDGMRHYWPLLMGSVPLLNHPDTRRYQPLIDGVHAFYYGVEDDDLKRVGRMALSDKARLRRMAAEGLAFIRPRHTHPVLAEYLIAETLKTASGAE
jgi:hypothetical protein